MKYVGAAEFKANCLRLMAEVQAGGEPITVTKRGKPVALVSAPAEAEADTPKPLESAFGMLKSDRYWDNTDPDEMLDPDWEAKWEAKWDERGFTAPSAKR